LVEKATPFRRTVWGQWDLVLSLVVDSSMMAADVDLLELGAVGIGELSSANVNILRVTATTASKVEVAKLKLHKDCRTCALDSTVVPKREGSRVLLQRGTQPRPSALRAA
jgi:hypothetical protein